MSALSAVAYHVAAVEELAAIDSALIGHQYFCDTVKK